MSHPGGRIGSLDGVRAVAVAAVMGYHGGVAWLGGGFLGVDVFFVLSGYLITTLLVAEWNRDRSISLRSFWARRARRLLPALVVVLVGVSLFSRRSGTGDGLAALRGDALATLAYVANWRYIAAGRNYFGHAAAPSMLQHTWSLAIEEQFYLVWPVAVLLVLRSARPRLLGAVAWAAAAASTVEMAVLFRPGVDPSRLYFGTDTHAQSVLVGAGIAVLVYRHRPRLEAVPSQVWSVVGTVGLAVTTVALVAVTASSPRLYRGGFLGVDLAVGALIVSLVMTPSSWLGRLLAARPLRSVGVVSYGLYLWHWPVFLVVDSRRTGLDGPALLVTRAAITGMAAVVSYLLVERPIRELRLPRWLGRGLAPAAVALTVVTIMVATATGRAPIAASSSSLAVASRPVGPGSASASASGLREAGTTGPAAGGSAAPPPLKALIEGDSVAMTLGQGLIEAETAYDLRITDKGVLGCGVMPGASVRNRGVVEGVMPECSQWAAKWTGDLAAVDPDLAILLVGRWEVMDRLIDGRWAHIGEPAFDMLLSATLQHAVEVLSGRGAKVALLTMPCLDEGEQPDGTPWAQDDPARLDRFNALVRQVASQSAGKAAVVDLAAVACPGGRFLSSADGVQLRYSDGVHFTIPGGVWIASRLLPELAAAARRPVSASPSSGRA